MTKEYTKRRREYAIRPREIYDSYKKKKERNPQRKLEDFKK